MAATAEEAPLVGTAPDPFVGAVSPDLSFVDGREPSEEQEKLADEREKEVKAVQAQEEKVAKARVEAEETVAEQRKAEAKAIAEKSGIPVVQSVDEVLAEKLGAGSTSSKSGSTSSS